MYSRLALLTWCCLNLIPCFSQTFDEVCEQAKKEDKIVMLVVETEKCSHCNEIGRIGLSNPAAKKSIQKDAIMLVVPKIPEELTKVDSLYSIYDKFFGVMYLDGDKHILTSYSGFTVYYRPYIYKLKQATKEKRNKTSGLAKLIEDYCAGNTNFCTTYALIQKIEQTGLEPQQKLIDKLTQQVPSDSINSLYFLQFVSMAAPEVGSPSEKYLQRNMDNYNMAWWRMSAATRSSINARIYQKSIKMAILNRDRNYLARISSQLANLYSQSGTEAMQAGRLSVLLEYFKGVRDTSNYLLNAGSYYDIFSKVNVDSILKIDSASIDQLRNSIKQNNAIAKEARELKVLDFHTQAMRYAMFLNDAAWTNYTYTKEQKHLSNALKWAKKANEFFEAPECMNTYARILYKTNNKELAIEWQSKAIDLLKSKNSNATEYEKVLEAMQNGSEKIDEY